MGQRLLIFAGAGASTAVNPAQFPTTRGFFAQLPPEITSNDLFRWVKDFLQAGDSERAIDIEQILWELQQLRDFAESAQAGEGIVGHSFRGGGIAALILGPGHTLPNFGVVISKTVVQCNSLIDDINAIVYDLYNHEPTPDELEGNWSHLLGELRKAKIQADFFTTNYDVVIETAASLDQAIDLDHFQGVTGRVSKKLNLEQWSDTQGDQTLLTKLHGSINWQSRNKCIHVGASVFTGNHSNHAIIYPGFKGKSEAIFFPPMHSYLGDRLETADALLFIGFAFRDEYVTRLLGERVGQNTNIFIINPDASVKYPIARRRPTYIHQGFDKNSINKVIAGFRATSGKIRTNRIAI
jgi:hypothetical protein